jgi:protein transport protein SEC20
MAAAAAPLPQPFLSASRELTDLEQSVLRELIQLAEQHAAHPLLLSEFQPAGAALRRRLRAHSERVDELRGLAGELGRPAERAEADAHVQRHAAEGNALLDSVRELGARVQANRPQQQAAERTALLLGAGAAAGDGDTGGPKSSRRGLSDRMSVQSARDATSALARTRRMMAEELSRSNLTLKSLDTQSKSLRNTLQEHRSIVSSLAASRRALSRLQRRDLTDKILLGLGFLFFCLVVLYIAQKRLGLAVGRVLWLLFGWWRGGGDGMRAVHAGQAAPTYTGGGMVVGGMAGGGMGSAGVGEAGMGGRGGSGAWSSLQGAASSQRGGVGSQRSTPWGEGAESAWADGGGASGVCEWSEGLQVYIGEGCPRVGGGEAVGNSGGG